MVWTEVGGGGAINLKYLVLFVYLGVMYMMIKSCELYKVDNIYTQFHQVLLQFQLTQHSV